MTRSIGWSIVTVTLVVSSTARAQESAVDKSAEAAPDVGTATRDGQFLPSTLSPSVGAVPATVSAFGGYDGARHAPIAGATAEVRLWGPIALRGGAEYSTNRKEARPTIGGRVQLLRQGRHGVDGAVSVFYRPEGFTEPEGEIETFVSLGRRFGRISVLGNLVYGQDPEGNERDGEIRLASLYAPGRWTLGFDSRVRFAIGPQKGAMALAEPKYDVLAGPVAFATVGPITMFAELGPSVVKISSSTSVGLAGLGGVGSVF